MHLMRRFATVLADGGERFLLGHPRVHNGRAQRVAMISSLADAPRKLSHPVAAVAARARRGRGRRRAADGRLGLIYGITGSGKRMTIYAADFRPADIARDVPLLAAA
jgi:hypothetical protein